MYQDSVNTALSGNWPVSFTINLGLGSISISPPSVSQSPISLGAPASGQNLVYIYNTAYAGALSGDTGFFGSGGSAGLNFNVTEGAGGTEVGTAYLTLPFQCYTELGSLGAVQDVGPGQTVTLFVNYIRGDHIPTPTASVNAGSYSLAIGQQTTLTVTVQNPSQVVSIKSGEVSIDTSSLGSGLEVIGAAQQNLSAIPPQGSATYVFTLQATAPGNFRPQFNVAGGWGSPVPSTKTFSVSGTHGANIVVPATITVQSSPSNGGSVTGGGNYPVGSTATLTVNPNQYFNFTGWSDGNNQNPRSVTVLGNANYIADFQQQTASIIVQANPSNGGTVSGSGTYPVGSQQQISASPANNWLFAGWSDGNTQNPRTITVPSGGATHTADFSQQQATITVVASPSNGGTVSGGGTFAIGSQQQISASANSGWTFTGWSDGNNSNPRTVMVPAGGATYTALFQQQTATVTLSSSPSGAGILNGGGTYAIGAQVTISATANSGWSFYEWSDGQAQNPRVIIVPTGGVSLTAIFTSNAPAYYTVNATSSPVGSGMTTGGGSFVAGSTITMTATPTNCYQFSNWTVDGVSVSQSSNYTFTVESNESLVANFVPATYTVTTSVSPSGDGSATGGGVVDCGDSATVSATNNAGYQFADWTQNGVVVGTSQNYAFVVQSNVTLVANFVSVTTNTNVAGPVITNVVVTGTNGNYTLTIYGIDLGAWQGQPIPFTGTSTNLSIVDLAQLGHAEWYYAGDANVGPYNIWNPNEIQVGGFNAKPGDAFTISIWVPGTGLGATYGGNIPGGAGLPQINSVQFQFSEAGSNFMMIVSGSNFPVSPTNIPYVGDQNEIVMQDHRSHSPGSGSFEAGWNRYNVGSPDPVTFRITNWTSTNIVIAGFAGAYGQSAATTLMNGDPVTIFLNSSLTNATGWGGFVVAPVSLNIQASNGNLTLTWPGGGTLQSAPSPLGPWTNVPDASSPYICPISTSQQFFHVRLPSQ